VATPAHKGFKKGGEHHLAKAVTQAKADVLEKVRAGISVQAAMVAAGKKPDTVRQWMNREMYPLNMLSLRSSRSTTQLTASPSTLMYESLSYPKPWSRHASSCTQSSNAYHIHAG
jgi:uncharacterized membrane protein (UPF0127 family)